MAGTKPTFPCVVYGVTVYSVEEGRKVCLKHDEETKAANAALESSRLQENIARYMRDGYPESEARFLATGHTPCSSVSAFI